MDQMTQNHTRMFLLDVAIIPIYVVHYSQNLHFAGVNRHFQAKPAIRYNFEAVNRIFTKFSDQWVVKQSSWVVQQVRSDVVHDMKSFSYFI